MDQVTLKRKYLEDSVAVQVVKADQTARDYAHFQQTYGVLDVTAQVTELSRSMATVQSQLTAKQLELHRRSGLLSRIRRAGNVKLKAEIEQLLELQREVREGSQGYSTGSVAQKDLPRSFPYATFR